MKQYTETELRLSGGLDCVELPLSHKMAAEVGLGTKLRIVGTPALEPAWLLIEREPNKKQEALKTDSSYGQVIWWQKKFQDKR